MNYELTGGNQKKPMPIMDNFVRDDWGGQITKNSTNPAEVNIRQDINGSTDKPYPQERNFVMNPDPDNSPMSRTEITSTSDVSVDNKTLLDYSSK